MHDVFISYSSKDKKIADQVCKYLEEKAIKCWYAPRDVRTGDEWAAAIVQAIKHSKFFILIYSERSNASEHVLREVAYGAGCDCTIIPFRIDTTEMSDGMSYYLNTVHWLDAEFGPMENNLQKLYELICSIENKEPVITEKPVTKKKKPNVFRRVWNFFKNHFLLRIVALFLVFAAAVCGFISILELFKPDMITFKKITDYSNYRYPFYSLSCFSNDRKMYLMENKETETLQLCKVNTGDILSSEIEYECEDKACVSVLAKANSNIIYFIDNLEKSVRVYDRLKSTWVSDEIILPVKESEYYSSGVYYEGSISIGTDNPDGFTMLIYDYNGQNGESCYSRIFKFEPDGNYTEFDISQYKIEMIAACIQKDNTTLLLATTLNDKLVVFDPQQGKVLDLTYNELLEDYLPYVIKTPDDGISDNNRYISWHVRDNDGTRIEVTDLQTNNTITETFSEIDAVDSYVTADNKLLMFNVTKQELLSTDLVNGGTETILSKKYFEENQYFKDGNACYFDYSEKLGLYFFGVAYEYESGKYEQRIVITDKSGEVKNTSQAIPVKGLNFHGVFHVMDNGQVFYEVTYSESENNPAETQIYMAQYFIDENGNVKWNE